jgi:hypothetical protein
MHVPSALPEHVLSHVPGALQWLRGSVPASAGEHFPIEPGTTQEWHFFSLHAESQHTPSVQNPLGQSSGSSQYVTPSGAVGLGGLSSGSSQSTLSGFEHIPLFGSQIPGSWQRSNASHSRGAPLHSPFVHVSISEHMLPSWQGSPFATLMCSHLPVAGLHAGALHGGAMGHCTGFFPTQTSFSHVSTSVQASLSSHAFPWRIAHIPF